MARKLGLEPVQLKRTRLQMKKTDRRTFMKTTAAGGAALVVGSIVGCGGEPEDGFIGMIEQEAQTASDQLIFNKYFKVEINGIYDSVPGVTAVDPGGVKVALVETTDEKSPHRTYTYGSHEYEDCTLTVQQGPGMVKLQEWADKAMKSGGTGDALRRDITINVYSRDKKTILKSITAFGCLPVAVHTGDGTKKIQTKKKTFTFTLNVDRIEVA